MLLPRFTFQIDEIEGGHSALHVACHEGHCDVIRELIDRGADKEKLVTKTIVDLWGKASSVAEV